MAEVIIRSGGAIKVGSVSVTQLSGAQSPVGVPTDGVYTDGAAGIVSTDVVADAVDAINERLIVDARDQTVEAITVQVNSGGTDPATTKRLYRQSDIDARGPFLTLQAAVDALPSIYAHNMTIELADGTHALAALPSFERFVSAGAIMTIKSASVTERPAGAPSTYAVASGTSTSFTLGSDPGFSANQFRGYFASIASGTGAGQSKAIRSHSGAGPWETAGRWNPIPDATSVIEILQPAAQITVSGTATLQGSRFGISVAQTVDPVIEGIDITPALGTLFVSGMRPELRDARVFGTTTLRDAMLFPERAVFEGSGRLWGVKVDGGVFRCRSTTGSTLVRNATLAAIDVEPNTAQLTTLPAYSFLQAIAVDDAPIAISSRGGGTVVRLFSTGGIHPQGANISGHFVECDRLAQARFASGFDTNLPSGTAGDILHDGVSTPYATLAGDPDQAILGARGSLIRV